MKLEVGMYVRGKYYQYRGKIGKIIKNYNNDLEIAYKDGVLKTTVGSFLDDNTDINGRQYKASYNIIDILEVGDVIIDKEGHKCPINYEFETDYNGEYNSYEITIDDHITLFLKDGLSIVTHEQMEQMSYKVNNER
nr:MAG TPA: hypothetical protein [Caudoviricetes sp.]